MGAYDEGGQVEGETEEAVGLIIVPLSTMVSIVLALCIFIVLKNFENFHVKIFCKNTRIFK